MIKTIAKWWAALRLNWASDESSEGRPNRVPRIRQHRVFRDTEPRKFTGVNYEPDRRQGVRVLPDLGRQAGKLDPNEGDPSVLWAEIIRLSEALKGPDGFATWQDAAVHERNLRVRQHAAQREAMDMSVALAEVAQERRRQIEVEGWTVEHDDEHTTGAMAVAAASYALVATLPMAENEYWRRTRAHAAHAVWPWDREWWKPTPAFPRRMLVKAAALIVAEIERLDRITQKQKAVL